MRPAREQSTAEAPAVARPSRRFVDGFRWAWAGLAEGAVRDRNMRVHLGLGVLAGAFAARAPIAPVERAVLLLCIAVVVAAEALNSALEAAVDLASPRWDERARLAKDAAAGAVLAIAAGSVLAFLAIAAPAAASLAARARALAVPAAGALAAALATALLPRPSERSLAADLALGAGGLAGVAAIGIGAEAQAGTAAALLCLAVAADGAARRRRRWSPR